MDITSVTPTPLAKIDIIIETSKLLPEKFQCLCDKGNQSEMLST